MEQWEFRTQLRIGCGPAYIATHHAIPAALDAAMRAAGVAHWVIRRRGDILTHSVVAHAREQLRRDLDPHPANRAWQAEVAPYLSSRDVTEDVSDPGDIIWSRSWNTR